MTKQISGFKRLRNRLQEAATATSIGNESCSNPLAVQLAKRVR